MSGLEHDSSIGMPTAGAVLRPPPARLAPEPHRGVCGIGSRPQARKKVEPAHILAGRFGAGSTRREVTM